MLRIPLGWMQLKRDKLRLLVALAGVAFAVVLILMQLGFRESMFASAVRYHERYRYDVALLSAESSFIVFPRPFADRRLFQALSVPGVASVSPIYIQQGVFKNPYDHGARNIYVVGVRPADDPLDVPDVSRLLDLVQQRDVVLFDEASRPEFGPVAERHRAGDAVSVELNHRQIDIGGLFTMGTSFGIDGTVLTSDMNFLRIFPDRDRGLIDLGLVRLAPGVSPEAARDQLRALLPPDVEVLTRADFILRERTYWDRTTPIGYVFAFGAIVGVVVGAIIVYQILFADVSDHLAEYATLKAMGYSNLFLSGVVLQEAIILATLGYLPGLALSLWLYRTASQATRLPIEMTLERGLSVFVLTALMCCASALFALRKVRAADPADVF